MKAGTGMGWRELVIGYRCSVMWAGVLAAGLLLAGTAGAAVNTSQSGGYWTNAATWTDGVPTSDDDVFIAAGHTITNTGTAATSINSLTITGTLTHAANPGTSGIEVNKVNLSISNNLTIAAGGRIYVDGGGFLAAGAGNPTSGTSAGGSYGGRGGWWQPGSQDSALPFGSAVAPTNLGCGGISGGVGYGGGGVILSIGGAFTNNGTISANGLADTSTGRGGGSGGSIYITCGTIAGSGTNKCNGGDSSWGAGGGGRMSVIVTNGDFSAFTGSMTAYGGTGGNFGGLINGAAGTLYKQTSTQGAGNGDLVVDNGGKTVVYREYAGLSGTFSVDNLIVNNPSYAGAMSGSTITVARVTSTNTTGSGGTFNMPGGGKLIASGGTLVVDTNVQFAVDGPTVLDGNLVLTNGAVLTHTANATTEAYKINLTVNGDFTVAANASVNVDGKGYSTQQGPGKAGTGAGGAAHGGQGSGGTLNNFPGVLTYGSVTAPTNLGSGGGRGPGGGAVILSVAGTATINGTNSANGTIGSGGGGSGGSIYITCGAIAGSGLLQCEGYADQGCGGGGRIAVVVTNNGADFSSFAGPMRARGGNGTVYGVSAAGTIYRKAAGQTYGELIVSNTLSASSARTLISTGVTDTVVGNVQLQGTAMLAISNTCKLQVYGNWSNGTANAVSGSGAVEFKGAGTNTLYGSTVFTPSFVCTNAAPGRTLRFQGNTTNSMLTALNIQGASGSPLSLLPATEGERWYIRVTNGISPTLQYLIVTNSTAVTNLWGLTLTAQKSSPGDVVVNNGANSNTNWLFPSAATRVWNGSAGTTWENPNNWTPNDSAPTPSDVGIIVTNVGSGNYPLLGAHYTGLNAYPCPLYIGPGASLGLNGYNLELGGIVTNEGAIWATASETLTFTSNVVFTAASGTFTQAQSTVRLSAAGAQSATLNGQPFYNLDIANANAVTLTDSFAARNLTFPATGANVTFGDGFAVTNLTLSVSGAAALNFAATKTYTVRNALYLRGASSGNRAVLTSSGTWYLNALGYYVARQLAVTNSDATGSGKILYAVDSVGANDTYWNFGNGALWTGSTTDWASGGNWTPAQIPASTNVVFIDGSAGSQPRLTGATTIAGLNVAGMSGSPVLTLDAPLTVTGNVVLADNAMITHTANGASEVYRLNLTVGGSLTEYPTAAINVDGKGYAPIARGPGAGSAAGGAAHGGQGGESINFNAPGRYTYGSITAPTNCGSSANIGAGGGVVILAISGAATLNGTNSANGGNASGGSAGGSIYITCGTLSGSGILRCNGGGDPGQSGGGGGRIAVVVTNGDFSAFTGSMSALGGYYGAVDRCNGAAGTVYRKAAGQAYGDLLVSNNIAIAPAATNAWTLISTGVTDTVVGNVQLLDKALLAITNNVTLTVNGSWSNAAAPTAISGGTVEFAGTSPATVWGDNNWYSLTITNSGKVVKFEAGKTQTITGEPTFDNLVTLKSTTDGGLPADRWILTKGSIGATQNVGRVHVRDSNAALGNTFQASGGGDLGNNLNWLFPPKGTVFMLR